MIYNKRPFIFIPKKKKVTTESKVLTNTGIIVAGTSLSTRLKTHRINRLPSIVNITYATTPLVSPTVSGSIDDQAYVLQYSIGTLGSLTPPKQYIVDAEFLSLPPLNATNSMSSFYSPGLMVYVPAGGDTIYRVYDSQNTASTLFFPWLSISNTAGTLSSSTVRLYKIVDNTVTPAKSFLNLLPNLPTGYIILFGVFNSSQSITYFDDAFILEYVKHYIRATVSYINNTDADVRNWNV